MNLMGFGQGWNEAEQTNLRNRQTMAKAFEEFKRNNPYASAADYQSFIDNMSGGSNYLRGGAPATDVLEALAKDNAVRKAQDETARVLELTNKRAATHGQLTALADTYIMNNLKGGRLENADEAYAGFIRQLGLTDDQASKALFGSNVRNMFTQDYAARLVANKTLDLLPKATELLKSMGGDVSKIDAAQFAASLGISPEWAPNLIKQAGEAYTRARDAYFIQQNATILNTIKTEVAAGRDPKPAVQTLLGGSGYTFDDKQYGAWQAEAERIRKIENDDRQRRLDEAAQAARNTAVDAISGNTDVRAFIMRGDKEGAVRMMAEMAKGRMTPEQYRNAFGAENPDAAAAQWASTQYDNMLNNIRINQSAQQNDRMDRGREAAQKAQQDYLTLNQTQAAEFFTALFGNNKAAGAIASDLARSYDLTSPAMRTALISAMAAIPRDMKTKGDPNEIKQFILNHDAFKSITANGQNSVTAAAQQRYNVALGVNGAFNVESYRDYRDRTVAEVGEFYSNANKEFDAVMRIEDPARRLQALNVLSATSKAAIENFSVTIGQRGQRADRWLEAGTGGWNDTEMRTGPNSLLATTQQREAALQARIQAAIAEMNVMTGPASPEANDWGDSSQRGSSPQPNPNAPSALSEWWTRQGQNMDMSAELNRIRTEAGLRSSPASGIFLDQGTRNYYGAINRFLQSEGAQSYLMRNPAEYQKFLQDPFAYIYNSDAGRTWLATPGGRPYAGFGDLRLPDQ